MKKNRFLLLILALVAFGQTAWAWSGSGTSSDPYLITSTTDWNTLATNVNAGTSYSGKYFKLTADIEVSEMIGTNDNRFSGTFNGDGHTLTFNKGTADNRFSDAYCGAFRYINGATIKRLHVAGTIYTSNQFAGMVGHAIGTNYIQSCHCSLTIDSSRDEDGTHGGFIANNNQTSYLTNCLFDGSFISTNTTNCGGFIGWTGSGHAYFTNCLFDPTNIDFTNASTCKTFARYNNSNADYTKCYYKQTFGTVDGGTNASGMNNEQLLAALGSAWQISGEKVVPIMQLQALTGSGTTESPYLIASADNWNDLAFNVNILGESYSGSYFKMTADITVSEMVGTDGNRFGGTFNGDGHKLTFNKGTSSNRFNEHYCAPFRFINDATIKRLHIDGTIYTSKQKAAVIGLSNGTNNIQLCRSSLIINSSVDGDGTHAGFIGVLDGGSTYFTDCLFDGTFEGSSTHSWGGFCGWARGQAYITNCLFAPTSVNNINTNNSATFSRNPGNAHITNSFYKRTLGDEPGGTNASSMSNDELVAALGVGWTISGGKVIPAFQAHTLTGNGTTDNPYLIATASDWNKLSHNVNSCDMTYNGKYFKLTDNITISATIGSELFPFGGIFDGDGHILNLNISDYSSQGTAPFRYISDATIKDVKTTGVVIGGIHCSGLVGFATGTTNLIQGCEVAAEVYCCGSNKTHCGGILGHGKSSNTTIQDCLFAGTIEGATTMTGIIFGWGDASNHTIINCLSSGDCVGGTVKLIAGNGTQTITNCYHSTAGPTDGTDASSMSRDDLQTALGAGWGTRGSHVVPLKFAESSEPQEGSAMVDLESDYTPTQIINGKFATRPWMDYQINGNRITELNESYSDQTIEASFPNGVNGGWNTTENKVYHGGLFEYMETIGGYNPNVPNFGNYVEMNAHHSAVLSQDLSTHEHDVIRWSLLHAVRTSYGPDVQSMRVEVGAPQYDGENIVAAIGIDDAVDSKITDTTKATYASTGYSGSYAQGGDNLAKLALSKTSAEDNSTWHTVRGIYMIPDGQTVTRFAFIATSANTRDGGNLLDNLEFSTLIGNLSAQQVANGDVILKGYWGETDESKHLIVETGSTTQSIDMNYVTNENFKITIPASALGKSTTLTVYHEDYPEAGRTISITPSYSLNITKYTSEANGWHLISSPIGTVRPLDVINMTSNTYDIFRFNQNPAITTVEGEDKNLEWENWKRPNEGDFNHYHFDLEPGRGYLYANSEDVTLVFSGSPYSGDGEFTLEYSEGNPVRNMWGWNLVGNPFPVAAYVDRPFYKMNATGTGIEPVDNYNEFTIPSCTGIMVQTNAGEVADENNKITFSTMAPSKQATNNNGNLNIAVAQAKSTRGNVVMDKVIVSFNEGSKLGKFYFGEQNANIYIPQGVEEYAIATSNGQSEMPLNFKANANGEYTITVAPENVEMGYLHLIDNMTGANVNLLQTPEYTFTAKTTDYESRFKLVFATSIGGDANGDNESFAFISDGNLIIANEGRAILQVIDVTGRIISSETINGSVSKSINQPAGVYMIRLINGEDVKVQKIVVR